MNDTRLAMAAEVPNPPDQQAIQLEASDVLHSAITIIVNDQSSLDMASAMVHRMKDIRAKVEAFFGPHIKRAFDLHRSLTAEKKKFTDELDAAERTIKPKISNYLTAKENERLQAQREAELSKRRAEEVGEKAIDKAMDMVDEGRGRAATTVMQKAQEKIEAIKAEAPIVPEAVKAEGITLREVWKFEVIAPELVPRKFLIPDEKLIGQYVRTMKHQGEIPGVRIWSEKTTTIRTEK